MRKNITLILILVFFLGFIVRLYRFDFPIADWHSFRQGDTNAVSERYANEGINFLYPKFFDISNLQSGLYDNPNGYFFVEFPIYNAFQAGIYKVFGTLTLVQWGRLISILATLTSAFVIYKLTKKYSNETAGLFASIFYLFVPYSIFYGRTILPEPSMTAAILLGIYFFDKWIEYSSKVKSQKSKVDLRSYKFFVLSILFCTLAFLLKPYALFFTMPIIYLSFQSFGFGMIKKWQLWVFALVTLSPLVAWRIWISQFPEGIPQSAWLFNGNGIRFRPAFFRWIFFERLTKLILGISGIAIFVSGIWALIKDKNKGFFLSFILSSLLFVTVIATGNIQHDYYQIPTLPTIAIICGLGVSYLFGLFKKNIFLKSFVIVVIFSAFYFSWVGISGFLSPVRDYFNINDSKMVEAGIAADKILPKDALVIASHDGSTTMLNLIKRRGWPLFQTDLEGLMKKGAGYIILADPKESDINGFAKDHITVASTASYLILKLKK